MIRWKLAVAIILALATGAQAAELLTIGSPAPKLEAKTFLLGDPVKELSKGTIYVVEFSGTQCVPCTKFIPHLTELQKKYKDIVIISVYSHEEEKEVRDFLVKHKDTIGFRVASDPKGTVWKVWFDAALREGIPHVFIVDATGAISWIGNAWDMADPLDRIVNGKYDPQLDLIRLKFEQGTVRKLLRKAEYEAKAKEALDRIQTMIAEGKLDEALTTVETALKEYAEASEGLHQLRLSKLTILLKQPAKKDAAVEFAIETAINAKVSKNELWCRQLSQVLLLAVESPTPKERDMRLVELAITLLKDTDANLERIIPARSQYVPGYRMALRQQLALAYHLRGDHTAAIRQIEDTIALLKTLKPRPGEEHDDSASSLDYSA